MNSLFFIVVGAVALAAALGVLLSRQPVHSALFLMANFGSLAVLYVTLDAQFLAAAQVIIYAGGIVILILFVIMLIGHEAGDTPDSRRGWIKIVSALLALLLLAGLGSQLMSSQMTGPADRGLPSGGTPTQIGEALFTRFLLPFEFVAILLLVALIGALIMGRKLVTVEADQED